MLEDAPKDLISSLPYELVDVAIGLRLLYNIWMLLTYNSNQV